MKISATVDPTLGKHYGTSVTVTVGKQSYMVEVWMPTGCPSDGDLESWSLTRDQWVANVEVDDGWGGTEPIQRMHPCDQHYQSHIEAQVAAAIAAALNGLEIEE
jgi:hypothetical protein